MTSVGFEPTPEDNGLNVAPQTARPRSRHLYHDMTHSIIFTIIGGYWHVYMNTFFFGTSFYKIKFFNDNSFEWSLSRLACLLLFLFLSCWNYHYFVKSWGTRNSRRTGTLRISTQDRIEWHSAIRTNYKLHCFVILVLEIKMVGLIFM